MKSVNNLYIYTTVLICFLCTHTLLTVTLCSCFITKVELKVLFVSYIVVSLIPITFENPECKFLSKSKFMILL